MLSSPGVLLLVVGGLLGLFFPLGRIGQSAGVPPLVWAALISLGAATTLAIYHRLRARPTPLTAQIARYFIVTGVVSYAIPNTLVFSSIPHLGSGLTAMFFTLSPLITLVLARLAGLGRPSALEYGGIVVGFVGALMVAMGRGQIGSPADWGWIALGFAVPLSLAIGNVYRSLDWPHEADPAWLAVGSHAVAAVILVSACLATGQAPGALANVPVAAAAQITAAATMIVLFFRLQLIAGAVTLSQVGTVAAGVGILIGAGALGERYPAIVWIGVAVIVAGLAMTIVAKSRK